MRHALFTLQVFLLMCTPLPQASYAAIGLGRTLGLGMGLMFGLYFVSDLIAFLVVRWVTRRVGLPGLARLRRRLPRRLGEPLERLSERAARSSAAKMTLPAMFAAGYANLYLAALAAGLSRVRLLPALLVGVTGDLLQFTGTVALAGMMARAMPFPGADWAALLVAPALVGLLPAALPLGRGVVRYHRRPRPAFLFLPVLRRRPAPVPVGVAVED